MRSLAAGAALLVFLTAIVDAQRRPPHVLFERPVHTVLSSGEFVDAAAADLNGDGRADLVVGAAGVVLVSLAAADGSFGLATAYPVEGAFGEIATGDFNGDDAIDILVAAPGITALVGNGDGTFQAPRVSAGIAFSVIVADFTGDGLDDAAGAGQNFSSPIPSTVDIYPSLGDGFFGPLETLIAADLNRPRIAAGDFNGDGLPDLAVSFFVGRTVFPFLNNGAMSFSGADSFSPGAFGIQSLDAADIDGNGTIDLVAAGVLGDVAWVSGNGDGTFGEAHHFPVYRGNCDTSCLVPPGLAVRDLNGDGAIDVATASRSGLSVLLNDGTGVLGRPMMLRVPSEATSVLAADVNGDGFLDLIAVGVAGNGIVGSTFLNRSHPSNR